MKKSLKLDVRIDIKETGTVVNVDSIYSPEPAFVALVKAAVEELVKAYYLEGSDDPV